MEDDRSHAGTEVGTASFQPTSAYDAKLVYVVTTPAALAATVTKSIQRQTLTRITLGGDRTSAPSPVRIRAATAAPTTPVTAISSTLQVDQTTDGTVTFTFAYQGLDLHAFGRADAIRQAIAIPTTAYVCSDGLKTNASMTEIKATAQGIEGRFSSPTVGGGCREDATFSAVLH